MNEKDLVLEKAYWIGKSKEYRGIYKGSFGYAHYFQVPFSPLEAFTRDANGYVEFPLRGVFEIEKWRFTTPIAMKCTEEQFKGIKDRLVEMGYKPECMTFMSENRYLCTVGDCSNNHMTDYNKHAIETSPIHRTVFETFNPNLFLALAAMTDKEDGIKGEWWKCVDAGISDFSNGLIYCQQKQNVLMSECFINGNGDLDGFSVNNKKRFRKATAQEIIEHFEKKANTGSLEFTVKVDINAEKVAEDIFRKFKEMNGYDKDEFVLQSGWFIELTNENYDIVRRWHEKIDRCLGRCYIIGSYYGVYEDGSGACWVDKSLAKRYQIINTDQFKKYVLKETETTTILIPSGKHAELFDDRVEITDWKPKEGDDIYHISLKCSGELVYTGSKYRYYDWQIEALNRGFILRTESEAKLLVEKLKSAML